MSIDATTVDAPKFEDLTHWRGRPLSSLSREELYEVIRHCGREIENLRGDRDRWRDAGDPAVYLLRGE